MEEYVGLRFSNHVTDVRPHSIDCELPVVCDDEYWIHPDPNLAFKQPDSKPSAIASWVCGLGLLHILAVALRTLVGNFYIL